MMEIANYIEEKCSVPKFKWFDITITWMETDRRRDPDNISSGIKFILDAFVHAGIIENDGWKQVKSIKHNFFAGDEQKIHIILKGEIKHEV